jgi:hypothetical protein
MLPFWCSDEMYKVQCCGLVLLSIAAVFTHFVKYGDVAIIINFYLFIAFL